MSRNLQRHFKTYTREGAEIRIGYGEDNKRKLAMVVICDKISRTNLPPTLGPWVLTHSLILWNINKDIYAGGRLRSKEPA
jgi:hypothetical protein